MRLHRFRRLMRVSFFGEKLCEETHGNLFYKRISSRIESIVGRRTLCLARSGIRKNQAKDKRLRVRNLKI